MTRHVHLIGTRPGRDPEHAIEAAPTELGLSPSARQVAGSNRAAPIPAFLV